jgi:hypothetical protein
MLIDLLGTVGILALGYLTYGVCRTDRKMCKLGIIGIILVLLAYVGRYVDMDRSVLAVVLLIAVVVVAAVVSGKI